MDTGMNKQIVELSIDTLPRDLLPSPRRTAGLTYAVVRTPRGGTPAV
jgi:hypothetical protein